MNIKVSSILKTLIFIFIVMKLQYIKLFGGIISIFSERYDTYPEVILYLFMTIICILFALYIGKGQKNSFIRTEILLITLTVIVGLFNAVNQNGHAPLGALSSAMPFMYLILAYPIYMLLIKKSWKLESMLKTIVFLGIGAYAIKALNSFWWNYTGSALWNNLLNSEAWIRNESLRINPPWVSLIFIPVAFYLMKKCEKVSQKIIYVACIASALLYTILIHQARSVLIYESAVLICLLVFERVSARKKLTRYLIIIFGLAFLLNSSFIQELFSSFSVNNSETGGSTLARFNAISYFALQYGNNPVFGIGFLPSEKQYVPLGGHVSDIGILGSFFLLGIPLAIVFMLIILRGFYISYRIKYIDKESYILVVGMTILILFKSINISCFDGIYAFCVPFYIAITEYVFHCCKNKEILKGG